MNVDNQSEMNINTHKLIRCYLMVTVAVMLCVDAYSCFHFGSLFLFNLAFEIEANLLLCPSTYFLCFFCH